MIPTPEQFTKDIAKDREQSPLKLGTIAPPYTSGSPKIIFDGEAIATTKTFKRISSYTPVANDRVLLAAIGGTYVILGKIV